MELGAGLRSAAAAALAVAILLLLPLAHCNNNTRKCGNWMLNTPGFTFPPGDIVVRVGNPLEIFCVLNTSSSLGRNHTAADLRVYNNETLVDSEYLSVVNETTLRYFVAKAPPMKAMVYCKLKHRQQTKEAPVCLNTVHVGYEPLGVDNFSCISYNWQSLNCTWVPKYNPVPTTYRVFFQLRNHEASAYKCPNNSDERLNTCVWNDASDPAYRQSHPVYKFTLAGENALKNKTFTFEMDHFKHILPAPPTNFEVVNATSSSFFLKWTVPFPMDSWARSYRLIHKIAYAYRGAKESDEPFITAFEGSPDCPYRSFDESQDYVCYYNLTGLQYAYYLYDIRVFIKTENASEAFWSSPVFQVKKTAPSIPPMPPRTDTGSFEVAYNLPKRDVTVYWQSLPENLHSGANFSYKIVEILQNNKSTTSIRIDPVGKKSVVLRNLTLDDTFVVRIKSSNEVGDSRETSVVTIPSYNQTLPEPESFTKTSLRNGDFKLTWRSPQKSPYQVTSYTIFWCDSHGDRPEICTGFLNWTHVNQNARELHVSLKPMMYHFAIAANSERGSSGMVWASCSMIADKVDKLKTVYVNKFDATSLDVEWKLHCTDANNVVKGFIIFYCVAYSGKNQECKEKEQNMTIYGDHSLNTARLAGLQPYVTYRISVAIRTEVGWSLPSDPIFKTLNEAAPSTPPTHIRVSDVTNNSITVSWTPPSKPNGVLRYYEVNCNDNLSKVMVDGSKQTQVTLTNLLSYTNYSIQIKACTVACSDASPPIRAQTQIGVPGAVNGAEVSYQNSSQVLVSWDPPSIRGGRIDFYIISMNVVRKDLLTENNTYEYNVTGTQYQVPIPDCRTVSNVLITFAIRAVNVDGDKVFLGEPTNVPTGQCYQGEQLLFSILYCILGVIVSLFILAAAVYYSRVLRRNCREVRDLTVKMPTGMLPVDDTKDPDFKKLSWGPHDPDNDDSSGNTRPAADKERLLQRKDDRHGESSGCSSGHDTVSSSTTSGTHVSTDSGTEMDRNEQGFTDSTKWPEGNTAVETNVKPESEWDSSPYVHVGSPTAAEQATGMPLYPNLEAANWLPATGGYVAMNGKEGTFVPKIHDVLPMTPQTKPPRGYVAHNAPLPKPSAPSLSALWSKPTFSEGYVQTGSNTQDVVEDDKDEELVESVCAEEADPIAIVLPCEVRPLSASIVCPSVLSGVDGERTSVEVPVFPTRTANGYVTHPSLIQPKAKLAPLLARHEYVRTAEKKPSSLKMDNTKPYTRLGEREPAKFVTLPDVVGKPAVAPTKPTMPTMPTMTPTLTPTLTPTSMLTASSGYVPHRQFENHGSPGVVRE